MEIRRQLIESDGVDVMVAISSNFFYTVTLPCTLWFLDKGKPQSRKDKVLFIDARHIFKQVTRSVRDYSSEQLNFIADIVRLYRGEAPDPTYQTHHEDERNDGEYTVEKFFENSTYQDIAGLCKVVAIDEIAVQGYSLNPGRYVGVATGVEEDEEEFAIRLEALQEELEVLNFKAHELERLIAENVAGMLS